MFDAVLKYWAEKKDKMEIWKSEIEETKKQNKYIREKQEKKERRQRKMAFEKYTEEKNEKMRVNFEEIYKSRKLAKVKSETFAKNELKNLRVKNDDNLQKMLTETEAVMKKREENKQEIDDLLHKEDYQIFFKKNDEELKKLFNYYVSQTYQNLGKETPDMMSFKQFTLFTYDFELVP